MDLFYKKIAEGSTASIYKKNNIVLKQYCYYCRPIFKIDEDLFYILKDIDNKNFVKLYKLKKSHDTIEGYTCEYLEPADIKIVYKDRYYTLDNINDLSKLVERLSYLGILINDAIASNVIMQNNRIVIIDPDSYNVMYSMSYDELLLRNKKELLKYIKDLYSSCFRGYQVDEYEAINKIFDFNVKSDSNLCYELAKRLIYKRPIDMINKIKAR